MELCLANRAKEINLDKKSKFFDKKLINVR